MWDLTSVKLASVENEDEAIYKINYESLLSDPETMKKNIVGPIAVGENPYQVTADFDKAAVASDKGIYIVDDSQQSYFYDLGEIEVLDMSFINKKQLFLICNDGVRLLNL